MKCATWLGIQRGLVLASLAGGLVTGCKKKDAVAVTQAALLDVAQNNYAVSSTERPPKDTVDAKFPLNHSVPDDSVPELKIATMTPTGPLPIPIRILARIRSDKEFRPMGIEAGFNYLWRNLSDSTVWITPARIGASKHQLAAAPGYVFPVAPGHEPSLYKVKVNSFAFVACLDDCPSGHCGMF